MKVQWIKHKFIAYWKYVTNQQFSTKEYLIGVCDPKYMCNMRSPRKFRRSGGMGQDGVFFLIFYILVINVFHRGPEGIRSRISKETFRRLWFSRRGGCPDSLPCIPTHPSHLDPRLYQSSCCLTFSYICSNICNIFLSFLSICDTVNEKERAGCFILTVFLLYCSF